MVNVTEQNKQDFANAKRFFEGYTFSDIKVAVESGCFKKADIIRIEDGKLDMNFGTLAITLHYPNHAMLNDCAEVYDDCGNCLGNHDFSKPSITNQNVVDWLNGEQREDGKLSNVEYILEMIRTNHKEKWSDFVSDKSLGAEVNKDSVTKWLEDNKEELSDILCEIADTDDIPDNLKEECVNDWFDNAYNSDIVSKVVNHADARDVARDLIDEI